MENKIDILDNNSELTGKTATSKEIHSLGLWHATAHVWFYNSQSD